MAGRFQNNKELFFVEMQTGGGLRLFTEEKTTGRISDALKWACEKRGLRLYNYVIIPDRVSFIANSAWGSFPDILYSFQKFTSAAVVRLLRHGSRSLQQTWVIPVLSESTKNRNLDYLSIWQDEPNMVSLFRQDDIDTKAAYIEKMPVQCGFVMNSEHYKYSSANPANPLDGWLVAMTDRGI